MRAVASRWLKGSLIATLCIGGVASAGIVNYGQVTIVNMIAGPRHGSMIQLSNGVWVCLDPDGETLSVEKSKRMYAFLLAQYMAGNSIYVQVYDNAKPAACGGTYNAIEDVRSNGN